jgi:hypothetical protein
MKSESASKFFLTVFLHRGAPSIPGTCSELGEGFRLLSLKFHVAENRMSSESLEPRSAIK